MLSSPRISSLLVLIGLLSTASPAAAGMLEGPARRIAAADRANLVAVYDGVALYEPAPDPLAIGFHEAGGDHPALVPAGRMVANHNPGATGPVAARPYPDIRVLPSRGRQPSPATSAIDIAVQAGTPVRSPVTGTVTAVSPYLLYGTHPDVIIEVEPDGRPDLRVLIYHLLDPTVAGGDRVEAGRTVVAEAARELPVGNQIDRHADACPCPHIDVRIDVRDGRR